MAWTDSRIFQQAMLNPITRAVNAGTAPTGFTSLTATDVLNVALFNNTTTPDRTAVVGSTGFNTGTWTTTNEVTDVTNWVSGGRALASRTYAIDAGSSSLCFSAANLSGGGNVTLSNVFGCFVYDNTITAGTVNKQGMCYNYFGGAQSVAAGTFTIVWATPGGGAVSAIFNITV